MSSIAKERFDCQPRIERFVDRYGTSQTDRASQAGLYELDHSEDQVAEIVSQLGLVACLELLQRELTVLAARERLQEVVPEHVHRELANHVERIHHVA